MIAPASRSRFRKPLILASAGLVVVGLIAACSSSDSSSENDAPATGGMGGTASGGADGETGGSKSTGGAPPSGGASSGGQGNAGEGGAGGDSASGGAGGEATGGVTGTGGGQSTIAPIKLYEAPINELGEDFTVSCGDGELAVSGGCDCGTNGGAARSVRSSDDGWTCACFTKPSGGTPTAYVMCTDMDVEITTVTTAITSANERFDAVCPEGSFTVGGGVSCDDNGMHVMTESFPSVSFIEEPFFRQFSRWNGRCKSIPDGGGNPAVTAYCVVGNLGIAGESTTIANNLTKSCYPPESEPLIAGGCSCTTDNARIARIMPVEVDEHVEFSCDCGSSATGAFAAVLCE